MTESEVQKSLFSMRSSNPGGGVISGGQSSKNL